MATVPAMGYETYVVRQRKEFEVKAYFAETMLKQKQDRLIIENELLKVELSTSNGSVISVISKKTNKELIDTTRKSGVFQLITEGGQKSITGWGTGMSSWFTGIHKGVVETNAEVKPLYKGDLCNGIEYKSRLSNSDITVQVLLHKGSSMLQYNVECDWREFGSSDNIPSLYFKIPLAYKSDEYLFDVPFGVITREQTDMDLPGCNFALAPNKNMSVALLAKTKYGYRCYDDSISVA